MRSLAKIACVHALLVSFTGVVQSQPQIGRKDRMERNERISRRFDVPTGT